MSVTGGPVIRRLQDEVLILEGEIRRLSPTIPSPRTPEVAEALDRERVFDRIQQQIGPVGDVYLRALPVERHRHVLANRVRELEGYETKYAAILRRCYNDKEHGCWCGQHISQTMEGTTP